MNRLEQTILKNLIYNESYTRKVLPFIRQDYFDDVTEKNLFKEIGKFCDQYNTLPTHEALVINFTESNAYTEEEVRKSISLLNNIFEDKNLTCFYINHNHKILYKCDKILHLKN